jgi:hypothetical protein
MIPVSNAWKTVQKQTLLPEMFVEIVYSITEPTLQQKATVEANYPEEFSNVEQLLDLTNKNSEAYAALDYGCWGLDGKFGYFDGSPVDPGYVDVNYSTDDGVMGVTPYPTITINFAERQMVAIPGLIITWNETFGGWATDFRVTVSSDVGVQASTTVRGNTDIKSTVVLDIVDYSRITIEVLKWSHPYQRPRCMQIQLGIEKVYTKDDLLGFEHTQSVDLLSATLPQSSIKFELRNDDARWNPDNPSGLEKYLMEQQEVTVRYGMDVGGTIEWIDGGVFWLSEWNTPSNGLEVVFTANDAFDLMLGDYTGTLTGSLYDIAVAAFEEAELPVLSDGSVRYFVDESLKNITTELAVEDHKYIISEILQMVAHAGCCVLYQDRKGVVHIEPWNKTYTNYKIEPSISYSHPEYSVNKPMKAISVAYGTEKDQVMLDVGNKGETQTISNPLICTETDALRVGENAKNLLTNRKVISGDFRADLRMDVLDTVLVVSKYASNAIGVTNLTYSTTGGSFRAKYTGRVISIALEPAKYYAGELISGEV